MAPTGADGDVESVADDGADVSVDAFGEVEVVDAGVVVAEVAVE